VSENKLVDKTKVSRLASMLEGLEFVVDKPKEKEKEEEIVKETEPETQTV
jgi:hypothetical protein